VTKTHLILTVFIKSKEIKACNNQTIPFEAILVLIVHFAIWDSDSGLL
jgi:hypothetical protein